MGSISNDTFTACKNEDRDQLMYTTHEIGFNKVAIDNHKKLGFSRVNATVKKENQVVSEFRLIPAGRIMMGRIGNYVEPQYLLTLKELEEYLV